MEKDLATGAEVFPHIRIVMGMVVGLGMTRLLSGVARIVQHPKGYKLYATHLAWVASVLLMLMHFWWWEFGLFAVERWTFGTYLFIVCYAVLLFLLSALLFPDSMLDYKGYEDFFISRRAWFFGVLGATYLFDVIDTLIKGTRAFRTLRHRISDPDAAAGRALHSGGADHRPPFPRGVRGLHPDLPDFVDSTSVRYDRLTVQSFTGVEFTR